jgi:hypothetical protein
MPAELWQPSKCCFVLGRFKEPNSGVKFPETGATNLHRDVGSIHPLFMAHDRWHRQRKI